MTLLEALERLLAEGGDANRVSVRAGDGWFAFSGPRGAETITVQAAGGRHLRLPGEKAQVLHDRGFRQGRASEPFSRTAPADPAALAAQVEGLATEVYGAAPGAVHVRLGDRIVLDDGPVVEAMRRLSKERSHQARSGVYLALVRARLLVAHGPEGPSAVGQMGEMPVGAVFTDWDTLEAYDPRGLPFEAMAGTDAFPLLLASGMASVQVNPHGRVGGELFRNELMTICEGIQRLVGSH